MAFTLLQAGASLLSMNGRGQFSSALSLPSGVTLATNRVPRFAKFNQYVVVVNTPSRPLSVDTFGTVRVLTPTKPTSALTLTAGPAGSLTGTYLGQYTYLVLDPLGNVISESDFSPLMSTNTSVTAQQLVAGWTVSPDAISAVQLYRTATGPTVSYFSWLQSPGNVVNSVTDQTSDAGLNPVAAPPRGSAPDLTLIAEWQNRLWGVSRTAVDILRYTEAGTMYAWSALNSVTIPHFGQDGAGITALIPRRHALGVAKRDLFLQVTGDVTANISPQVVHGGEQTGCLSQESVIVYNDDAYFLWRDGVYKWDSNGIQNLSDGKVRSWFTTDTYFNRAMFWRSFAQFDPTKLKYRLFLAAPGSAVNNRWIEYDLVTKTWWGPHSTTAFTPTSAVLVAGLNQQPYLMIGSQEGFISRDQEARNDWGFNAINMSAQTKRHDDLMPDTDKYYGELSVLGFAQGINAGGTLTITPNLDGVNSTAFSMDTTKGRVRLPRIGQGKQMLLQFDNNLLNQDVVLYGYEVNPVVKVGRR